MGIGKAAIFSTGGLASPIGWPIMAHGLDQLITGVSTMVSGNSQHTATSQLLRSTGFSSTKAHLMDEGLCMLGTMGAAASLRSTFSLAKLAQTSSKLIMPVAKQGKNSLTVGKYTYTETAAKHILDLNKKGVFKGELSRPYMKSELLIEEIMAAKKPIPDPRGANGAVYWNVKGTVRGSLGEWELVMQPDTKTIYHFLHKPGK